MYINHASQSMAWFYLKFLLFSFPFCNILWPFCWQERKKERKKRKQNPTELSSVCLVTCHSIQNKALMNTNSLVLLTKNCIVSLVSIYCSCLCLLWINFYHIFVLFNYSSIHIKSRFKAYLKRFQNIYCSKTVNVSFAKANY